MELQIKIHSSPIVNTKTQLVISYVLVPTVFLNRTLNRHLMQCYQKSIDCRHSNNSALLNHEQLIFQ